MTASHAQRKALGDYGERLACRRLVEDGLVVLDRNWRCRAGEIDIVAVDGPVVVVCEVKTRSGEQFGTPVEAITAEKAARLYRLGLRWITEHRPHGAALRVDVICVVRDQRGPGRIEHLKGVA